MVACQLWSTSVLLFFHLVGVASFAPLPVAIKPVATKTLGAKWASSSSSNMQSFDDDNRNNDKSARSIPAGRNPDRPELPELKGDFDWDAKFGQDDDWIVENVPGKIVLDEITLARQVTELTKLEDEWRKEAELLYFEKSKKVGFVEAAELINGRTAMFFLVTGLLTEYWTGYSLPRQVEEMLRVGGFLGME